MEPMVDDAPLYVMQPPQAVAAAERQWREICPVGKPFSVSPMPIREDDPWATGEADTWLALLQDRPDALDSLDVLDDLRAMALMHEMPGIPGVEQRYFVPLLERAVAIIDNALALLLHQASLGATAILIMTRLLGLFGGTLPECTAGSAELQLGGCGYALSRSPDIQQAG